MPCWPPTTGSCSTRYPASNRIEGSHICARGDNEVVIVDLWETEEDPAHDGEPRVPAEPRSRGLALGADRADLPGACHHPVIGGSRYPVAALTMGLRRVGSAAEAVHAPSEPSGSQRSPAVHLGAGRRWDPGKQAWVANPDKDEVQGGCHRRPYEPIPPALIFRQTTGQDQAKQVNKNIWSCGRRTEPT
jgi:hypothetical protein